MENKEKLKRILIPLLIVLFIIIAGVGAYFIWEKPPEAVSVQTQAPVPLASAAPSPPVETIPPGEAPESERKDGVYTLLLAGKDELSNSTDTIIICRFDTKNHKLNAVTIPRDTLINNDWEIRKINCVYAGSDRGNHGEGIKALMWQLSRFTGFVPDCYAVVDLKTVENVIDTLGGVYFDVPVEIEKEDWMGEMWDYWDTLEPGYQLLNGFQCVAVCRHRHSYMTEDLGRISVQQDFLKAAASQFITLGNIPNASKVINILADSVETNLSSANIAYFMRQLLMCSEDDVSFYTMPVYPATLQGYSYAVVDLESWLPMLNEDLNPYERQITANDLDLVYHNYDGYFGTHWVDGSWYFE